MKTEKLFDIWARRNPKFEVKFEDSLFRTFTDFGVGASELTTAKGKIFGGAYELYIYAFFIGLYKDEKLTLSGNTKTLGQPIQYWGNVDNKIGRKEYSVIQDYMFVSLIARTPELDLIELEKGEITPRKAVDYLINTMEQYTNAGLYYIEDKLNDNPNYFYTSTGFLDEILKVSNAFKSASKKIESLD